MAMICVSGCRECTGCMACEAEPQTVGTCEHCNEPIYAWEDHYDIEGELLHDDCLVDWADKYRKKS